MKRTTQQHPESSPVSAVREHETSDPVHGAALDEARRRDRLWRLNRRRSLRSNLLSLDRLPNTLSWFVFMLVLVGVAGAPVLDRQRDAIPLSFDEWLTAVLVPPLSPVIAALLTRGVAQRIGARLRINIQRRARNEGVVHEDEDPEWFRQSKGVPRQRDSH